jgi:hypothetical protein
MIPCNSALRALRALRFISFVRALQVLVNALFRTIQRNMLDLFLLLALMVFLFAVMG